jgi:glycosyltransferase involved in cell wall biosynthesis
MRTVAYLVPEFPLRSEAFVAREVLLASRRMPVHVISLGHVRAADVGMRTELAAAGVRVDYVLRSFPLRIGLLALRFAVRSPVRSGDILRESFAFPRIQGSSALMRALKAMACAHIVRRRHIGHLHGHWTLPTDVAWICSLATGVPFSFSAHAHDIYEDGAVYAASGERFALGRRIGAAAFVATCTRRGFERLRREAGPAAGKVKLVYHGVELDETERELADGSDVPRRARIVGVGRLVEYKGFDRLVRCCASLRDEGVPFTCEIVGEGSQRERLARLVANLGLEQSVLLSGPRSRSEVLELLKAADVFVFCGRPELGQYGLPNVLLEAMACGAAVVTTWLPEVDELVRNRENGLVVSDDDELHLAVRELLEWPELRSRLAARGRSTVEERFDAATLVESLVELFERTEARAA